MFKGPFRPRHPARPLRSEKLRQTLIRTRRQPSHSHTHAHPRLLLHRLRALRHPRPPATARPHALGEALELAAEIVPAPSPPVPRTIQRRRTHPHGRRRRRRTLREVVARDGDGGDVDGGRARAGRVVHDDVDGADAGAGADGVVRQVVVSERRVRGRRGRGRGRRGEMLQFGQEGRVVGRIRDDDDGVALVGAADPGVDAGEEGRGAEHLRVHGGGPPAVRPADVAERREIRPRVAGTETAVEGGVGGHVGGEGDVGFGDGGRHGTWEVADGGVEAVGEFGDGGDVVVLALVAGVAHRAWGGGEAVGSGAGGAEFRAHLVGVRGIAQDAVREVGRADATPGGGGGAVAEVRLGAAEMRSLAVEGGRVWDVADFGGSDQ